MYQDILSNQVKMNVDWLSDDLGSNDQKNPNLNLLAKLNKITEVEGSKSVPVITNSTVQSPISLKISKELLGSVTTFTPTCGPDSGHTVRTSARVIQKMRLDSIRPPTPPNLEKKEQIKEEKPGPKTPSQIKPTRNSWTHTDTIFFFEALNEYGKDFESIAHYVNTKSKRKNSSGVTFKTRDQIRIFYYQSLQKVSKYLKFSEDVKKLAQELYALINYGEMRKKLMFVNEKSLMKLRDLVYKGWVTIRSKGRNIKIKTPSCKALRQLNQLEEWQEEIKLPPRIEILLKPFNVETWGKVHSIAQNPRVKMTLPIQRRVSSIIKTLQSKWKIQDYRLCDKSMSLQQTVGVNINKVTFKPKIQNSELETSYGCVPQIGESSQNMRILPPPSAVIHRPMVNITEFLSSNRICLNSYEERIGVKIKGETLCSERINTLKEMMKTNSKRQRHDSEKKSPEFKKSKLDYDIKPLEPCEKLEQFLNTNHMFNPTDCNDMVKSSGDEGDHCNDEDIKNEKYLSDNDDVKPDFYTTNSRKLVDHIDSENDIEVRRDEKFISKEFEESFKIISKKKVKKSKKTNRKDSNYIKPLISEETMKVVREGWTLSTIGDITVGDLYVMLGHDLKLNLEYSIANCGSTTDRTEEPHDISTNISICGPSALGDMQIETIKIKTQHENGRVESLLGSKLRQLMLIANLMEQKKKKQSGCICGHNCERNIRFKKSEDFSASYISNKTHLSNQNDSYVFRPPTLPARNSLSVIEPYKLQPTNVVKQNQPSKLLKMKNRQSFSSKQVVVKRILPLQPKKEVQLLNDHLTSQSTQIVSTQQTQSINIEIKPPDITRPSETCPQPNSVKTIKSITCDVPNNLESMEVFYTLNDPNVTYTNKYTVNAINMPLNNLDMPNLENSQPGFINNFNDKQKCSLDQTNASFTADGNLILNEIGDINLSPSTTTTICKETSISHLAEDSSINTEWLTPDINDFSFSSFLGHLDNLADNSRKGKNQDENLDSNLSIISESSIDYMTKFAQITAELKDREYDGCTSEVKN